MLTRRYQTYPMSIVRVFICSELYFVITLIADIYTVLYFCLVEDGIRDATVTGVQTCALPISSPDRTGGVTSEKQRARTLGPCASKATGDPRRWTVNRSSCCARWRSVTSGSSGCGSPTCSGS